MKTINKTSLLLALIILAIAFSIISMIAAPAEIRYSWHGLNPVEYRPSCSTHVQTIP